MNTITVTGNLGRSPVQFTYGENKFAVRLVVANTEDRGEKRERTSFVPVIAFGSLAQNILTALEKGDPVVVTGEWSVRSWKNDKDEWQERQQLVAQDIGLNLRFARVKATGSAEADPDAEQVAVLQDALPA